MNTDMDIGQWFVICMSAAWPSVEILIWQRRVYQLPMAPVTNDHQLSG